MHKLTIEDEEGKTVVVPLIRDEITIGRQDGNTIRLTEKNISRRHARMFRKDGTLLVEDLGSYNGVKVNGTRLSAAVALNDGDLIVIGDYKLGIKADKPTATLLYTSAAPIPGGQSPKPAMAAAPAQAAPIPVAATPAPAGAAAPTPPPASAYAVPEPMDGSPTIPVRTLADQGLVPGISTGPAAASTPPAKLAAISTNLAGSEFLLDRASLVIGRTPENDIVLNHKSISRHHAKIIRDGNSYVVVDLESANGVRVNGAQYERTELSSGDVVELGHVKLRFVQGDDAFGFDAGGYGAGSKKKIIIGAGLGAVALGAILIMLVSGGKKEAPKSVMEQALQKTQEAAKEVPKTGKPAAPAVGGAGGAAESADTFIARAKAAAKDEKWAEALDAASKAAGLGSAEASELQKVLEIEGRSSEQFATLKRAAGGKQYDAVLTAWAAIPDGSTYRDKARPLFTEARGKLVGLHVDAANRLAGARKCGEAKVEAEAALALDGENAGARSVVDRCSRVATPPPGREVVAVRKPDRPAPAPRPARPVAAAKPPEAAATAADPDALMQDAQDAWLKGQYAAAIESSKKALRVRPGLTRAYQIIAVCSCSLRNGDQAKLAYDRLDEKIKPLVKQACSKSGITIE